ncbi:MAG: FAD-dependent monooxygenase [Burkholderiales bacterium]
MNQTLMQTHYDIAIVGGGLVGASLACALRHTGYGVALLEAQADGLGANGADKRVYALSPASQEFLTALGVWGKLDPERIQPVRAMQIFGDDGASRLEFSAYQSSVDRLASIVTAGDIRAALWEMLSSSSNVDLFCPATASQILWHGKHCEVRLAGGGGFSAKLLVGADGMHSAVRAQAGIDARIEPAGQMGVVANFRCALSHHGSAFQWFREDGVLAWLPLPGNVFSMVWSTGEIHARELINSGEDALCEQVRMAGGGLLGELQLMGQVAAFPLAWLSVRQRVRERLVLIGDAAHVVHPLAGQGINLGLGDARELAALLEGVSAHGGDPGQLFDLRKFERARAEDILAMRLATKGLKGLFEQRSAVAAKIRNTGLNLTDKSVVIKNMLARHAMG